MSRETEPTPRKIEFVEVTICDVCFKTKIRCQLESTEKLCSEVRNIREKISFLEEKLKDDGK